MPNEKVSAEQIRQVLKQNGISSLEELSERLAKGQNSKSGVVSETDPKGMSWVIKVFRLDEDMPMMDQDLPDEFGGKYLRNPGK